ncbi:MAG TPA: AMP-binding protein, partial [Thermoanaerobaculia bacterium]|nr:AMP-binding protein [Thermoanaerobaculia bacterium]
MYQSFNELVSERGDALAVLESHGGHGTSRRELLVKADEIADQLAERGVGRQDILAIQLPNSAAFVAGVLASFKLGAVLLPIDRDAPPAEVEAVLQHFDVRALLFGGSPRVDIAL